MSDFLRRFAQAFATLDKHNLQLLDSLYSKDIAFTDPLHDVQGLPALHRYFAELYGNISQLRFDFQGVDEVADGEDYLRWKMSFCHPRLADGKVIRVEGCSHLMWRENKVYRHRDYFDAGALLYEHLPIIGRVVRWLKRRMG